MKPERVYEDGFSFGSWEFCGWSLFFFPSLSSLFSIVHVVMEVGPVYSHMGILSCSVRLLFFVGLLVMSLFSLDYLLVWSRELGFQWWRSSRGC